MSRHPAPTLRAPASHESAAGGAGLKLPVPPGTGWDRRMLLAVLAGAIALSLLLVAGLGYAGWRALAGDTQASAPGAAGPAGAEGRGSGPVVVEDERPDRGRGGVRGQEFRDRAAAAPMLEVAPEAATPPTADAVGPLSSTGTTSPTRGAPGGAPGGVVVPVPTGIEMGPATVMTGFPRTPEGAVAQLAQIEVSVLQAMSLPVTAEVHAAWSLPGSVTLRQWALTGHVSSFLAATAETNAAAAGATMVKDPAISVTVTPVGASVKAVDGPDWVVACVLSTISAVYRQHRETSLGHCERMQWAGGRWLIAPGTPPAPAPSTWP
ncbi:MAG: hypothetical protein WA966_10900, partial [Ornithinimicrobium sp.]